MMKGTTYGGGGGEDKDPTVRIGVEGRQSGLEQVEISLDVGGPALRSGWFSKSIRFIITYFFFKPVLCPSLGRSWSPDCRIRLF